VRESAKALVATDVAITQKPFLSYVTGSITNSSGVGYVTDNHPVLIKQLHFYSHPRFRTRPNLEF
jgi:hypothetical protein